MKIDCLFGKRNKGSHKEIVKFSPWSDGGIFHEKVGSEFVVLPKAPQTEQHTSLLFRHIRQQKGILVLLSTSIFYGNAFCTVAPSYLVGAC